MARPHGRGAATKDMPMPSALALRWLLPVSTSVLVACASPGASDPVAVQQRNGVPPGIVSVTYADAATAQDARNAPRETAAARRAWLGALSEHLSERAAAALPAGQRLEVQFTEVRRAGSTEPWQGPQAGDLRVVRDLYPPRIDLDFRRLGADGRVLQAERRQLRDTAFMLRPSPYPDDPLRYEKVMLDDWVRKEFGAPH